MASRHDGFRESVRALYVEDEPPLREVVAEYLEQMDDTLGVVTEPSAAAARARLDAEPIDCVVSDHRMPGTDGVELCRTLREEGRALPFILLTGRATRSTVADALDAGVDDYVEKGRGTETYARLYDSIEGAVRRARSGRRPPRQRRPVPEE